MVPLRYKLKNGDIVEILTAAGHNPSRDWLALTVTNKARAKIRHYLNTAEKQQALEIGKKHFERELKRYDLTREEAATPARRWRRWPTSWASAQGSTTCSPPWATARSPCARCWPSCVPAEKLEAPAAAREARAPSPTPSSACCGSARSASRSRAPGDLLIYRAKCCNPIMGEPIVGYITRGKGVSVHAQSCPNVVNLMYDPERRIAVEWERGAEGGLRGAHLGGGGGPPGPAGRHHRRPRLHEHRHPQRGGQDLRRPHRLHRPHPAHPGPEAPREGA